MCFMFCDEDAGDNLSDMYFEHIHEICPSSVKYRPSTEGSVNYGGALSLFNVYFPIWGDIL